MKARAQNSIRNITYGMCAKIVTMLLPFIIRTIIIKKLGIEYAGLNNLFTSILNFLSLSELGFGATLVYMMYKPVADNDTERLCALLNYYKKIYHIIGFFILIVGIVLMPIIPYLINSSIPNNLNIYYLYSIYLINTVISYFLFSYRSSLFIAFQRTDVQSRIMVACYIGMAIFQSITIIFWKNYYIYALGNVFFTVAQNLFVYKLSKIYYPEIKCRGNIEVEETKQLFSRTIALAGHKIGGTIVSSLDILVISKFLGLTAVGIYGNYYTILAAIMGFIGVYNNALLPSIGNYVIEESREKKYHLFMGLNFVHLWIVGWASVCLYILLPEFISLWVGDEFLFNDIENILICAYFYMWQFRVLSCNFKDAAGLWTEDFWKPYVASAVNIVLNIYLVNIIGVGGALISTIVCMAMIFFPWETKVLFDRLFNDGINNYIFKMIKWTINWIVIAIVTYFICIKINQGLVMNLIMKMIICIFVPNFLFYVLNFKTVEFIDMRRKIDKWLKKK